MPTPRDTRDLAGDPQGYPPAAAGLDPVGFPPDFEASSDAPSFQEAISPSPSPALGAADGVSARDKFYFPDQVSAAEAFKRNHFSTLTWIMIVIAGIVLGGAMAMMAAGA